MLPIKTSQTIRVVNERPPMWDEVEKKFNLEGHRPIFAYGTVVYNPYGVTIPDDLIVHEATHQRQQGGTEIGAKLWWIRYLADTDFMVSQEVEAYNAQYEFMCKFTKDRNKKFKYLHSLALQLSGDMYGSPISYQEAQRRIKNPNN